MTEFNQVNNDDIKKLFDEHQQLYLDLLDSILKRRSILFFCPEEKIDPYKGHGDYFKMIIDLDTNKINDELKNNVLYLPGIKITKGKVYTELELGKTIAEDIQNNCIKTTYFHEGKPKWPIFNHFNIENDTEEEYDIQEEYDKPINNNLDKIQQIIPKEITDSVKKIEQLQVEIIKEKNKILETNYVKLKLNENLKNIDKYIGLAKLIKDKNIKQFFEYD